MLQKFEYEDGIILESGERLNGFHLAYHTYGKINADRDNVIWVFHALTANSDAADWWDGLVGAGKLFDPATHFIVCVNMPGSCYGSIGPLSKKTTITEPFFHDFPFFTPRDMVRCYSHLKDELGIESIEIGIGGSMGGQQLLEWAIEEPALFKNIIPIATNAKHSPWGIAFNATQRMAIENDATWLNRHKEAGLAGMQTARSLALLSYRHYDTYGLRQMEIDDEKLSDFKSETYQQYQGRKLAQRFNAFSYYALGKSMDSHNVGRGRGSVENALSSIVANTLVIGISSDLLFPVCEQQYLSDNIRGAVLHVVDSFYGHDGFLLEFEQLHHVIDSFLNKSTIKINQLQNQLYVNR